MAVILTESGDYQPICQDCGIALCWTLDWFSYEDHKDYWDRWKCETCDPGYFNRWKISHTEKVWASLRNSVRINPPDS
jgi:hypothetical protein